MKVLNKFTLTVFSVTTLLLSIVLVLLIAGWIEIGMIDTAIEFVLAGSIIRNVILALSIIFIVLALITIFFGIESEDKSNRKEGILLENENGKLLVSKDTIESLANTVVKTFDSAETVMTRVDVDEESKVTIFITLFVKPDAIIKDLSAKLQNNVKDAIKKSLDLEVKEVNIRIKNIAVKKEIIIKE